MRINSRKSYIIIIYEILDMIIKIYNEEWFTSPDFRIFFKKFAVVFANLLCGKKRENLAVVTRLLIQFNNNRVK